MFSAIALTLLVASFVGANGNDFDCTGLKDGNYVNPNDCGSYIACVAGLTYVMPCPEGLFYDPNAYPEWGACVYEYKHCKGNPTRPPPSTTQKPTQRPTQKPTERPTQKPTHRPTHRPTHGPTHGPTTQKSTERPTQKPTTQAPPRPTTSRPDCPETTTHGNGGGDFSCKNKKDGNYPNPRSCESYIACSGGIKYVMPCPAGLHFNWHKGYPHGQCDYPEDANCLTAN